MAPFAPNATCAIDNVSIHKKAAADSCSENDGKDNFMTRRGTVMPFGQGQTVCIIGKCDRCAKLMFKVCLKGFAVEAD